MTVACDQVYAMRTYFVSMMMLVGLLFASTPATATEACNRAVQNLEEAIDSNDREIQEVMELAEQVAAKCSSLADAENATASLCYPHDLVPLACASASSNPQPHDCRQVLGVYTCDYTVEAGGGGSGLLAAGNVFMRAFDGGGNCGWITVGGSCTTPSHTYEIPGLAWGRDGCATTNTITITTFFVAQAQAKGDCW